jgi:hypothetical protein
MKIARRGELLGYTQRRRARCRRFTALLFADALGALTQITDAAFAEYRTDPGMIAEMHHRYAQRRRELLAAEPA